MAPTCAITFCDDGPKCSLAVLIAISLLILAHTTILLKGTEGC